MKKIFISILMVLLIAGCAAKKPKVANEVTTENLKSDSFEKGMKLMENGLKARAEGKDEDAKEAFNIACKYFRDTNNEERTIMLNASAQLKKVISMSGFEYAQKDSFVLLALYLDMQNAYMDSDPEGIRTLEKQFYAIAQKAQETTVEAKQKRLADLSNDNIKVREEIKNQGESNIFEVYPAIYVVKTDETLQFIAARHDIYNDSFMWPLIYKANRDQIKDPKAIYAGQDLKIPRDMSIEEIIAARREAGAPDPEKIPKDAFMPRRKK